MPDEKPFDVSIDRDARVITIQGIRYSFDMFDNLGFAAPIGSQFEIGKRKDGVVTLIHRENFSVKLPPNSQQKDAVKPVAQGLSESASHRDQM